MKETGTELQERSDEWPLVSIVTVSVNGRKWLKGLFQSILDSDYPLNKLELIYVDNGSIDGSIDYAQELINNRFKLEIIKNSENIGWSPANNQGIKIARGQFIFCISNDMEVDSKWIKDVVRLMMLDVSVGIVQCNSISLWDRRTPDSGMNYLDKFGFAYSYAPLKVASEVFYAEGMAFVIRKEIVKEIGFLDEYFFMEYDDMDYSWRARLAGYRVMFVPTSKVYHARGGTVGSTYFQRINNAKWYTRNHLMTLIKNYEFRTIAKVLPLVLIVESAKILYLLIVKKNQKLAFAASKGIFNVLTDMRIILKKRTYIQQMRKVSDKSIMKSMYPFNPWSLKMFLTLQAKGKRLAITTVAK